ncbi:MAG: MoaD/ThiS family protein [Anaerolineaceae bacterium]|nr:MAG: MoaD/ThiS family protein [Anaerolineaceae bacterium]
MNSIRIPTPLRPYTDNLKEVEVDASNVGEALDVLTDRYPNLRPHLFDENGNLRAYVNIFVQQEDVRNLRGQATPLTGNDRLMIVPSIAGGKIIKSGR